MSMYYQRCKNGEQYRAKNFALVKSALFEGLFVDAKGVNCMSLEIVHAKKIYFSPFF